MGKTKKKSMEPTCNENGWKPFGKDGGRMSTRVAKKSWQAAQTVERMLVITLPGKLRPMEVLEQRSHWHKRSGWRRRRISQYPGLSQSIFLCLSFDLLIFKEFSVSYSLKISMFGFYISIELKGCLWNSQRFCIFLKTIRAIPLWRFGYSYDCLVDSFQIFLL